jgi:hypothetical protein
MSEEGKNPAGGAGEPSPEQTLQMSAGDIIKRRSRWQSSLAALRYIDTISKDNEVQLRDTDRATSLALLVVCVVAFVSLLIPQLEPHRLPLVLSADVLVGVGLMMYVSNRFGIVTTLTPRQAILVWQLMLGASLLGIFLCLNLGLLCTFLISDNLVTIVPR